MGWSLLELEAFFTCGNWEIKEQRLPLWRRFQLIMGRVRDI
jgi:hypothetical protein